MKDLKPHEHPKTLLNLKKKKINEQKYEQQVYSVFRPLNKYYYRYIVIKHNNNTHISDIDYSYTSYS